MLKVELNLEEEFPRPPSSVRKVTIKQPTIKSTFEYILSQV